jgi:phage recombination protein Bet
MAEKISAEQALAVLEPERGTEMVPGTPWTRTQALTLARTIAPNLTVDEFRLFGARCAFSGLDPFAGQIHAIIRGTGNDRKLCIQTGIDGLRLIAARTGEYMGQDEPEFEYDSDDHTRPALARVTVYRWQHNQRVPYVGTARWNEFCPRGGKNFLWQDKPHAMLSKTSEAQALRRAFPAEMSQVYTQEELHRSPENTPPANQSRLAARLAAEVQPESIVDPDAAWRSEAKPTDLQTRIEEKPEDPLLEQCRTMIAELPEDQQQSYLDTLEGLTTHEEYEAYQHALSSEIDKAVAQ